VQTNITGTPTYYAGGGSGGTSPGGAGGGGNVNSAATVNTGGAGGGGSSGSGGSGIVIIRYPDNYLAATSTTGSPTITVTGGYRIYKWISSGSITI
jgi:hypothetical protein